jgi:hypothetical protein
MHEADKFAAKAAPLVALIPDRNGLFISGTDKAFYDPKKARGHFSSAAKIKLFVLAVGQVPAAHIRIEAGEIVIEGLFNFQPVPVL